VSSEGGCRLRFNGGDWSFEIPAIVVILALLANLIWALPARSEETRPFEWTNSDWGGIGLLQMRNARFGPDGELTLGASFVAPYDRYFVNLQALPWLEGTFRYTLSKDERLNQRRLGATLTDRGADHKFKIWDESYWRPAVALGVQDMLGTGLFDGEYLVFSKRYYDLDFSFGFAWGYPGNRGTLSNPLAEISPFFRSRDEGFSGLGGIPEVGKLFSGERMGVFGGVEYHSPFEGLTFKLEYDGNDYKNEPVGGDDFGVEIPWNYGVEYSPWPWLTATLMQEREEGFSGRVAVRARLHDIPGLPKFGDRPPPELRPRPPAEGAQSGDALPGEAMPLPAEDSRTAEVLFDLFSSRGLEIEEFNLSGGEAEIIVARPETPPDAQFWYDSARRAGRVLPLPITKLTIASGGDSSPVQHVSLTREEFFSAADVTGASEEAEGEPNELETARIGNAIIADLEAQGFAVDAVGLTNREIKLYFAQSKYRHISRAIGRAARIAANHAPRDVEIITVVLMSAGITTGEVSLTRTSLEKALTNQGSPEELWHYASFRPSSGIDDGAMFNPGRYPNFGWKIRPKLRQHLGRPGQFHRYQFWLKLEGSLDIYRGLTLTGALGKNVHHNFGDLDSLPVSNIQHVRTEIVNYLNKGENNLVALTLDYIFNPAESWYFKMSGGYFEEMFAGFGGEVLYRPYNSRWAAGIDIYKVYQREFEQRLGLQEDPLLKYDTITGHATVYYELPLLNLFGGVSLGRYLAQDIGGTVEISRRFDSGVMLGTWFTITDLSAGEFGEGSFDKGIYITVPWDLFFPTSTGVHGTFPFRPLTRDGGQKLSVNKPLHGVTGLNYGFVERDWDRILD
jgi:hypothetical protein